MTERIGRTIPGYPSYTMDTEGNVRVYGSRRSPDGHIIKRDGNRVSMWRNRQRCWENVYSVYQQLYNRPLDNRPAPTPNNPFKILTTPDVTYDPPVWEDSDKSPAAGQRVVHVALYRWGVIKGERGSRYWVQWDGQQAMQMVAKPALMISPDKAWEREFKRAVKRAEKQVLREFDENDKRAARLVRRGEHEVLEMA